MHFCVRRIPFRSIARQNFLDLTGGARSVIDLNALTQPQIDDVLLA